MHLPHLHKHIKLFLEFMPCRMVFVFPSPGLERRRIQVQIATCSPWKPSTSLLSTTLSTETFYASAKTTPFFYPGTLTPQDKRSVTQAYFPKHTVFLSPTDPDSAKPAAGVGFDCCTGDQVHESHPTDRETRFLQTAGTCRHLQHRYGIVHCVDGCQFVRMAGEQQMTQSAGRRPTS